MSNNIPYGFGIVDCNGAPLTEYHGTVQQMESVCRRLNDTPNLMGVEFKPFIVVPVFYRGA